MKLKLGDVVKNPKSHNWGYGKVFEVTSDKIVKVRFENIDHTKKISAATLEKVLAKNEKELKYEKMSYFEFLVQIPIDEIDKKKLEGKEIYEIDKIAFEKGKNTKERNEDKRPKRLEKIVNFCGGNQIPYSFFCFKNRVFSELYSEIESKNVFNYITYDIFMGLEHSDLKKTSDGLKYIK